MERALFLDFDGVICDSVDECFVSSLYAAARMKNIPLPGKIDLAHYHSFRRMRPLVRKGEEYLILQEMLQGDLTLPGGGGLPLESQWQSLLDQLGREAQAEREKVFTAVRDTLVREQREWWLRLNPLYPLGDSARETYGRLASDPRVFILSTKVSRFIHEILAASGVQWPLDRILYAGGAKEKALWLKEWLDREECRRALFLDDHPEHLERVARRNGRRVHAVQALWGYGVRNPHFEGWSLGEAAEKMESFLAGKGERG